mgnify:CR=1 FL=1
MREPLVMDSEHLDHLEELVEALSEGYHVIAETPERRAYYEALLEELRNSRPQ